MRRVTRCLAVLGAFLSVPPLAPSAHAQISITPDGQALTAASGESSYTATFTVTNLSGTWNSADLWCSYPSGTISYCEVLGENPLTLAYGSAEFQVSFTATTGSGTLLVDGLGMGGSDAGSYNVTIQGATYALSVAADSARVWRRRHARMRP